MNTKLYQLSKILSIVPLNLLIKATRQHIILPFYHTVSDDELIHIKYLYKVKSVQAFERDLDFFLKYYEPIDYGHLFDSIKYHREIKKNSFLLSFDDGLSEFHDIIAPILKRKGIPAVCFLNSDFIDNKNLFFRYKASVLIDTLRSSSASKGLISEVKSWCKQSNLIYDDHYQSLLSLNYSNRNYLNELANLIGFDFDEYLQKYKPYMSAEQIHSLIKQGFIFGAHSIDHPKYSDLDEFQQLIQTKTSISEVTTKFNLDYKIFSFPFTDFNVPNSFFESVFSENGPIADLTFGCAGLKHDSCKNNLQRIPVEIDNFTAQEVIYGEYIYYIVKAFFNKNTIKRV